MKEPTTDILRALVSNALLRLYIEANKDVHNIVPQYLLQHVNTSYIDHNHEYLPKLIQI